VKWAETSILADRVICCWGLAPAWVTRV
jgi:hypothetical protein